MVSAKDAQLAEHGKRIRELEEARFQLAGQLGFYQAQVETLRERIALLEGPKTAPEAAPSTSSRPWWRFWRRGG